MRAPVARSEKARPRFAWRGPRSLERKLPLLMMAVVVVVLTCSLVLTYGALALSAEVAVNERLQRAVREIASSIAGGFADRAARLSAVAGSPAVRRHLVEPAETTAVRLVLERLASEDSLPVELWNARGDRVLFVGPEARSAWRAPLSRASLASSAARDVLEGAARSRRVSFAPFYAIDRRVFFWGIAPVFDGRNIVGYVAQERRVTGPARATRMLRELTGEDVSLFMRDRLGAFWVSAPGEPAPPATERDSGVTSVSQFRPGVGRVIAVESPVDATPWLAVLEAPLHSVRARARAMIAVLAALSILLVAIGAAFTVGISRRVTRPLVALTRAAEEIAAGRDYRRAIVDTSRGDEIGRLAGSFAQMADEVATSRQELERRVDDAQSSADALDRANRQLQEAIGQAELARQEAERASRAKSDFLAVMSHELRTPLNAIAGYAQLLELEVFGPINESQRDALARIGRSQDHLLALINNVLDFVKIDAGQARYTMSDVLLDDVLSGLELLVAPQMRAKGLAFEHRPCGPHILVHADAEKLQQVVINLLTNAIKFTPAGGRVVLQCDADERMAHVHVHDTGVGIPAERLHSVFEPFVQGDRALNRPNEGVGLGLAIARDLAHGMGGSLHVESRLGEGSVFTVSIPRVTRQDETSGRQAPQRTQHA